MSSATPSAVGAGAVVRFEATRRPETAAHVTLETWEGPLGLLLSLIEARQLDILTVPLGSLADAYLDALAGLDGDRMAHVSSFIAVASQLILIKSRALLPRRVELPPTGLPDEEADPEAALRARLLLYRAYRDAGASLQALALERLGLFRREPAAAGASAIAGARPVALRPLDPILLAGALERLAAFANNGVSTPGSGIRFVSRRAHLSWPIVGGVQQLHAAYRLLGIDRLALSPRFP